MKKNKMRLSSLIYELPRTLLKTGEEASKTQELFKNKQETNRKTRKHGGVVERGTYMIRKVSLRLSTSHLEMKSPKIE